MSLNLEPSKKPLDRGAWIRRRARRLMRAYNCPRRIAIFDAWVDWIDFMGDWTGEPA